MTQTLPYAKIEVDKNTSWEVILATADDAEIGSFVELDMKRPGNKIQETKDFPIRSEYEKLDVPFFTDNMKKHST